MIFKFWKDLPGDAKVHPEDQFVLGQITHNYDLRCLPGPYRGPLKSAAVVLLFANPGLTEQDKRHAAEPRAQEYYVRMRTGIHRLPSREEHETAYVWAKQIAHQFELDYEKVRHKLAMLNLSAYKSEKLDRKLLIAIPSCRVTLDWAQKTLFPSAVAEKTVVVCMRGHSSWGLKPDADPLGKLFAPSCTRNGKIRQSSPIREQAIEAVREALSAS